MRKSQFYDPVTRVEVTEIKQPIVAIFLIFPSTDVLGYRLLYNNEAFYETHVSRPQEETYFYDPLTTFRALEKRKFSRAPEINRSIARKIAIDTFNFLTSEFKGDKLNIYLKVISVVLNIPHTVSHKSTILRELKKLNDGIVYKESFYDPLYIVNPGLDLPLRKLDYSFDLEKTSSVPSAPRRAVPPVPD